jgi:hypothetical protein
MLHGAVERRRQMTYIEVEIGQVQAEILRCYEEKRPNQLLLVCKDGEPVSWLLVTPCIGSRWKGALPASPWEGKVRHSPDAFGPLPDDLLAAFNKELPDPVLDPTLEELRERFGGEKK